MLLVLAVFWQHQDGVSANGSSVEIRYLKPGQAGSVSKVTGWTQQPVALAADGYYRQKFKKKKSVVSLEIA